MVDTCQLRELHIQENLNLITSIVTVNHNQACEIIQFKHFLYSRVLDVTTQTPFREQEPSL